MLVLHTCVTLLWPEVGVRDQLCAKGGKGLGGGDGFQLNQMHACGVLHEFLMQATLLCYAYWRYIVRQASRGSNWRWLVGLYRVDVGPDEDSACLWCIPHALYGFCSHTA
jgi:hypothetical protein